MRYVIMSLIMTSLALTAGCSNMSQREQRALSGSTIGAAGGAALGAVAGGSWLAGARIGGIGGAAIAALLPESRRPVS